MAFPSFGGWQKRLTYLSSRQLMTMRRGIEREGLRVLSNGHLALTPHPNGLGKALTHPRITTDYSESQLELITGVHGDAVACLDELQHIHQAVVQQLHMVGEMLWAHSMPCQLPTDETIPLARYGSSHLGRAKSVYRMGLGHRYGRRMQTISGIHYNWSLAGVGSEGYFGLIRNFRRHAFVLLRLLGASPAVCSSFVEGRSHDLLPLPHHPKTRYLPWATTLRMGRLGYQSEAQSQLNVSYNSLEGYAQSLHEALTAPWSIYEQLGIKNPGGDYNQLATTLLQIENEFYSTIRPKRTIFSGERPLHALRQRGVEYVEVRLLDLNPFDPLGIPISTMHFLDVFLLYCLLSDSPPDTPNEIADLAMNQQICATRGREPGIQLTFANEAVDLEAWGGLLLDDMMGLAEHLDRLSGTHDHVAVLEQMRHQWHYPDKLPSARLLEQLMSWDVATPCGPFIASGLAQSEASHQALLAQAWPETLAQQYQQMAVQSRLEQAHLESACQGDFERYRLDYVNPERLIPHEFN